MKGQGESQGEPITRDRRIFRRIMWVLLVITVLVASVQTAFFVTMTGRPSLFFKVRLGMSKAEVRTLLGDPTRVGGRVLSRQTTRDVWEYEEEVTGVKHYLVFHNNRLIGWDLPRPFDENPYGK